MTIEEKRYAQLVKMREEIGIKRKINILLHESIISNDSLLEIANKNPTKNELKNLLDMLTLKRNSFWIIQTLRNLEKEEAIIIDNYLDSYPNLIVS